MKEKVLRRKEIRRVLSAVLCLVMCLSLMPTTVFAAEYINKVNITGISDPVAGERVGDNLDKITTGDSSYVIANKRWWCNTSGHIKQMSSDDVFEEGLEYSLQVYVEPSNSAFYMNEDTVLVFNSGNYATDYYSLLGGTSLIGTTVSKTASLAPKYTVTFNMNGHGTAPAPQTVVKGSRLTEPDDPTASGYVFGGWYIDPACQNCYYSYYTIEEDTILYAKWLKNINTVNALGVKAPIAGQKVKDFQNIYIADSGCYLEYAQWMKYGTDNALQDDESFSEGVEYVFKCWVTCKEDSGFAANVTALINDSDVYVAESYPREGGIIIRSVPFTAKENICVNTGNHDFSKYVSNGNGTHKIVCKDCGAVQTGHDKDICSGGTATSTSRAKCTLCGAEYGALADPVNNGGEGQKPQNNVAVSGTIEQVEKDLQTLPENGDLKGSTYATLQAKVKKTTKSSVKLSWKMVPGAAKYTVYGTKCGTKYKKLTDVQNLTWTQKKLKKGTYYKYIVVASDASGKILATSKSIHAATTGGKYGNQTSIKLSKKKVSLKQGKTVTIKATIKNSAGKVKNHRKLTYESSNTAVATVSKKGKIKAVGAGTCTIYAYAQNGICASVKVTVK